MADANDLLDTLVAQRSRTMMWIKLDRDSDP
jgi:hypothetical protein